VRSTEKIKKLIKNLKLDVYTNSEADQRVLGELLQAQEKSQETEPTFASPKIRGQKMSDGSKARKVAAVVALMVATAAVGAKIYKWRVIGRHPEAGYLLQSEDGGIVTNVPENWADSPEQAVEVKEDLDLQEQQGKGELVGANETEVNGTLQGRSLIFKYTLANGREVKTVDRDTEDSKRSLTRAQKDEIMNLLQEMKFEDLEVKEEEVRGRVFVFDRMKFILSDGTEVIKSVGRPK